MSEQARVQPFYCGSQSADFETANCFNCHLQGYYADPQTHRDWVWRCDIQRAFSEAYMLDGTVSEEIGRRMGAIGNETARNWRCPELIEIRPAERYFAELRGPKMRLQPLWKRLRSAVEYAMELWNPWWRPEVDIYGIPGRIPLSLAWHIAWNIHDDDKEPARCRKCGEVPRA